MTPLQKQIELAINELQLLDTHRCSRARTARPPQRNVQPFSFVDGFVETAKQIPTPLQHTECLFCPFAAS
jgi:hypothetical protein